LNWFSGLGDGAFSQLSRFIEKFIKHWSRLVGESIALSLPDPTLPARFAENCKRLYFQHSQGRLSITGMDFKVDAHGK
jgi:hypothetical protein